MNTSIAVLGLSSSGKTALIHAFEKEMSMFEPKIRLSTLSSSEAIDNGLFHEYNYELTIAGQEKLPFSITEYSGEHLKRDEDNPDPFDKMMLSLTKKTSWIIMIDGAWFESQNEAEIEKTIRRNYARTIVPLVSEYAEANEGHSPELMFVVSKVNDYLLSYLNENGKKEFGRIVTSAFGGLVSNEKKPLILLADTCVKTATIAVMSLVYLQYRKEAEITLNKVSIQNQKIDSDLQQLRNKLNIENGKMLKSNTTVQELEQHIHSLEQERKTNQEMIINPAKDTIFRNVGIALHRLMLRHTAMLASGFENVQYSYDDSKERGHFQTYWSEKFITIDLIVALIMFVLFIIIQPKEEREMLFSGFIAAVVWGLIAVFVNNKIVRILGILGIIGGLLAAFNIYSIVFIILYVTWFMISTAISNKLEAKRAAELNIPIMERYKDELVRFYDEAVRKG